MTKEEVIKSGKPYVECPKCKEILAIGWAFDTQNRNLFDVTCHCANCGNTFYGRRRFNCLELFDRKDVPLFQNGDYTVQFMKFGKVSFTGMSEVFNKNESNE